MDTDNLIIVGGSAAGARAAQVALASGYSGHVHVISRDPGAPYYRPALSKQLLSGAWTRERTAQPLPAADRLSWHIGVSATGLDLGARTVALSDGEELGFDRLILASGCQPRTLPSATSSHRVRVINTIEDVDQVVQRIDRGTKVVVIGAGLIGSEVASTMTARGVEVTAVDPSFTPLARALGPLGDEFCVEQHRLHGVDLRLGVGVTAVLEDGDQVVVELDNGDPLVADLAIQCIGVVPDTGWLAGSAVPLRKDGSVDCDAHLMVRDCPGVAAAGDVASWPSERAGRTVRVEHWLTAVEQGAAAARSVLSPEGGRAVFDALPMFWTEQHGHLIHALGFHDDGSDWKILEDLSATSLVAAAIGDGRATGYLMIDAAQRLGHYRQELLVAN